MALVERLMHLEEPHIPEHTFFAAGQAIVEGSLTVAQVKTAFGMDAAAIAEFDAMVALAPNGTTALATAQKSMYVNKQHSVFLLANDRRFVFPGYSTPAEVRVKLGI